MRSASPILKTTLHVGDGVEARLLHYPAGLIQPMHRHEQAQLSLLLAGGFRETTRHADIEAVRRASGLKPRDESHAAEFGPHGALMLSMTLAEDPAQPRRAGEWLPSCTAADALVRAVLSTDDLSRRGHMIADLRGLLEAPLSSMTNRARHDVARRLRKALDDQPDGGRIDAMARELGLHRTHLSRCFVETFGLAPSLYRSRTMAARAIARALRGQDRLADVAADTGFADQSHLARVCCREIGVPLSRIRALFSRATSVQGLAA